MIILAQSKRQPLCFDIIFKQSIPLRIQMINQILFFRNHLSKFIQLLAILHRPLIQLLLIFYSKFLFPQPVSPLPSVESLVQITLPEFRPLFHPLEPVLKSLAGLHECTPAVEHLRLEIHLLIIVLQSADYLHDLGSLVVGVIYKSSLHLSCVIALFLHHIFDVAQF
jgi:hypothetical protein